MQRRKLKIFIYIKKFLKKIFELFGRESKRKDELRALKEGDY